MDRVVSYLIILDRIKEKHLCDLNGIINRNVFLNVLGVNFKIPKQKKQDVLKDMKKRGLIDELNKFKIKISCLETL